MQRLRAVSKYFVVFIPGEFWKIFGLWCVILWLLSTYLKLLFSNTAFSHSGTRIKNEYGQGLKVAWLCNGQRQKRSYSFWQKDRLPPLHLQRLKSRNNVFCCLQPENRFFFIKFKVICDCTLFCFFAMVIILLSPKRCAIISSVAVAPRESSQSQTPLLLDSIHTHYSCPSQCLVL